MIKSNCILNNSIVEFDSLIDFDKMERIDAAYSKLATDESYLLRNFTDETGIFLDNSIKMNYIATGKFDFFLKYVNYFIGEFRSNLTKNDIKILKVLVSNLIFSSQTKFRPIHYFRGREHFKKINGKNVWMKYDSYKKIINHFEQKEYFYNFEGFHDKETGEGAISRMIPSKKFIEKLMEIDASFDKKMIQMNCDKTKIDVVQFKKTKESNDEDGPVLNNVKKTQIITRLENKIIRINNELKNFDIKFDLNDKQLSEMYSHISVYPDVRNIWYRRIFNNCSENSSGIVLMRYGGRFYDETCNIPSEFRKFITINGNKTLELDISATHPSLLYATNYGKIPEGDLYKIDYDGTEFEQNVGVKVRDVCKVILTAAINMNEVNYKKCH